MSTSGTEAPKSRRMKFGPLNFYIADWHYNHANVIAYDNRPFQTLEEMNAALVQRWNSTVEDRDTVYVLGDMFCRCGTEEAIRVLKTLHGKKVLIRGNHDYLTRESDFCREFEQVTDYLEIEDGWRYVILCHYPIPCFNHHFREEWCHLYGHVHNSFEWNMMERFRTAMEDEWHNCEMYNAGAMMPWMDYTPRTLDEITVDAAVFRMKDIRQTTPKKGAEQSLLLEAESDGRENGDETIPDIRGRQEIPG